MEKTSLIEVPLNSTYEEPKALPRYESCASWQLIKKPGFCSFVGNPEVLNHNPYNKPSKTLSVGLVKLVEAPLKGTKSQLDELT